MNKEEYAKMHYLLAKVKYEHIEMLTSLNLSKNARKEAEKVINAIETLEKVVIIDGKEDNKFEIKGDSNESNRFIK